MRTAQWRVLPVGSAWRSRLYRVGIAAGPVGGNASMEHLGRSHDSWRSEVRPPLAKSRASRKITTAFATRLEGCPVQAHEQPATLLKHIPEYWTKVWSALTPTLSPRRGSAARVLSSVTSPAATVALSSVARAWVITARIIALPLLGERVGVRADVHHFFQTHHFAAHLRCYLLSHRRLCSRFNPPNIHEPLRQS